MIAKDDGSSSGATSVDAIPTGRWSAVITPSVMPSVDADLVEVLIIAESQTALEHIATKAYEIAEVILLSAQDVVDVCSVLGCRQAMLIRTTRRDFDAAVDALTPMLAALRKNEGVRIEMESKLHGDLTARPITRYLA